MGECGEAGRAAAAEARCLTLGSTDDAEIDDAVGQIVDGAEAWVLIGGPPCQAYSLVGRARRSRQDRGEFERDERHFLYRHYLRFVADYKPSVFVMENVKGLLSARIGDVPMFDRIREDLQAPGKALRPNGPTA